MRQTLLVLLTVWVASRADTVVHWLGWPWWTGLPIAVAGSVVVGLTVGLVWPRRRAPRQPPADAEPYVLRLWAHWGQS